MRENKKLITIYSFQIEYVWRSSKLQVFCLGTLGAEFKSAYRFDSNFQDVSYRDTNA